ncbi:MAG: hypothetical protein EOP06_14535 [Proteobacteria bacterium]|nr:MAG: hypothetical protein EOP06_14535 [Pseudomonadota bacterium]
MNQKLTTESMLLTPVGVRCSQQEFREGYVRGYVESANMLLSVCETIFEGNRESQDMRDKIAAKIAVAAAHLDNITAAKYDDIYSAV